MDQKRVYIQLSYKGTRYSGWQIQPNAPTVQADVEKALSKLYNQSMQVVGCGRTDAGVHAVQYFCHLDVQSDRFQNIELAYKLNGVLGDDISIAKILDVKPGAHARFDATLRSYFYNIHFDKNPFLLDDSFRFNQSGHPEIDKLQAAANLLKTYSEFYPFCKSHTDVDTYRCQISESYWETTAHGIKFNISANRFLRGMVRLIVGMCLNVSTGKVALDDVKKAMDSQTRLKHAWSVPANGLFLSDIKYPYL